MTRRLTRRRMLVASIAPPALHAVAVRSGPPSRVALRSPNGRIAVEIRTDAGSGPSYSISFDRRRLIASSLLGLRLADGSMVGPGLHLARIAESHADRQYTLVAGKTRRARDHYNQLRLQLAAPSGPGAGHALELTFRAYDDGIAFRYRLARRHRHEVIRLAEELTGFNFADDCECWGLDLGAFDTGHEGEFRCLRASAIAATALLDMPLVCRTEAAAFAIAEADLRDYAGLYLRGRSDGAPGVRATLSPRPDAPGIAVLAQPGQDLRSPWRVVMIADRPGDLLHSTLITSLNPPSRIADTGWIKGGKYAWDWWNGGVVAGTEPSGMNNAVIRRFIDFAAATGLQYMLIDAGWYVAEEGDLAGPTADITCSIPAIDLPALVEHADRHRIGLFVWVHWKALAAQLDEALALYQRIGLKGIKVDFMDRNDQLMVDFYHALLAKAARHRLLVNLHGAYPPTGLSRTYPNLLTQEGVMGAEYNKWSARVTATHNVTLPFTRMLLGPMDYTPGGFRHVTPAEFIGRDVLPLVQTTRGHALAMYVVYDSPLVSLADTPDAYAGAAGLDFLTIVPTTWDETRVLAGDIGQCIVIARRTGDEWFVGAMTNEAARIISVALGFLGNGRFTARIYADGVHPCELAISERSVSRDDTIVLRLASGGGGAIALTPGAA